MIMKKKTLSILLFFSIIIEIIFCIPLGIAGSQDEGLKFESKYIYEATKKTDRTPATFEAWIKLPQSAASGRGGVIWGNYGDSTSPVINFEIHNNGNPRLYWLGRTSSDLADCKFTDVNVCTGEWLHLSIVRDKSKGRLFCYVNGEQVSSMPLSTHAANDMICVEPFVVGGDLRDGNGQYFKGSIRSVAIYDSARTANDIKNDMTAPEINKSLISYYELSSGLNDLSGNGYDLTKRSSIVWISQSKHEAVTDFDYTFAVVGDTQTVSYNHSDKFHLIYDWIISNKEKKNIKFVMGLGDITEKSLDSEWNTAMTNILRLKDEDIPFSLVRGNHDTTASFNKYYSYSEFSSSVSGAFEENMLNTWQKFSVGNRKYIVFALDFGPNNAVLNWASKIIESHPDHNVIITTHAYLYRDGTTLDATDLYPPSGNTGDHIWTKLIKKYENIVLVISGHDPVGRIIMAQDKGDNGNVVTQMLVDFQHEDLNQGGLGIVTLLHFSEGSDEIQVETFSTIKKQYYKLCNQFTFTLDFVGEDPIDEAPEKPSESEVFESLPEQTESSTFPESHESSTIESTNANSSTDKNESDYTGIIFTCVAVVIAVTFVLIVIKIISQKKKKQ